MVIGNMDMAHMSFHTSNKPVYGREGMLPERPLSLNRTTFTDTFHQRFPVGDPRR